MKALQGVRILNTRPSHQAASLTKLIEQRGGISIEIPLISIAEPNNGTKKNSELQQIFAASWIIFTSVNSFEFTSKAMADEGLDIKELLSKKKIAAVGSKTKEAVEKKGFEVALYPDIYTAEHLAEELIVHSKKEDTFFYPRSSLSRKTLVEKLNNTGRNVFEMVVYETIRNEGHRVLLNELIKEKAIDVAILTSPSAVESFFAQVNAENETYVKEFLLIAVIGSVTEDAVSRYDIRNVLIPETFTLEGVLSIIERNT